MDSKKQKNRKWADTVAFLLFALGLVLLNIANSGFFFRLDLTEEQRYSINPATKNMLRNLEDVVTVEVYLDGEMPAGFKRFQRSIKETLNEFRIYGGDNIQYFFTDPSAGLTGEALNNAYLSLAKKGLTPTNLTINQKDQRVEKIIFPGAMVSYQGREQAVLMLKGNFSAPPEIRINQSIEGIEFELAKAIQKLSRPTKKKIAVTSGNGEWSDNELVSIGGFMSEFYDIERINLRERIDLKGFDAVIVPGPDSTFSEADRFKIDQFIVKGGKALILLDVVAARIDSIGEQGTYALAKETGLEDLLFKLGVRLNPDLIQDLYCSPIPLFVGYEGDKPVTKLTPWKFYPLINQFSDHPITRNLDAIYSKFVGSMDTVKSDGIIKTPLIFTSKNSRIIPAPVRLNFSEVRINLDPKIFNKGPMPVAYLLEGSFKSSFEGRVKPEAIEKLKYMLQDKPSKVIVVSDADIIANDMTSQGQARPVGYDRFTQMQFANKDFILNALEYLLDDSGVILSRTKQVTFRPMDKEKLSAYRTQMQVINVGLPIFLVLLFAFFRTRYVKSVYQRNSV